MITLYYISFFLLISVIYVNVHPKWDGSLVDFAWDSDEAGDSR